MDIACLGWGSLIWDPGTLPLRSCWHRDGPRLPVEFARHSDRQRITLVLVPGRDPVPTLWALLDVSDLATAREELRRREGRRVVLGDIHFWGRTDHIPSSVTHVIGAWAQGNNLDGVVWTALPPKWDGQTEITPKIDQVLDFLRHQGSGSEAERYVRKTPAQVRTPYRERIEAELGWTPWDCKTA